MNRVRTTAVALLLAVAAQLPALAQDKPAPRKEYELRVIRVGSAFQSLRWKVATGETWLIAGDRYEKLPEATQLPPGDYDVTLITDDMNWMAFRINRTSGATWQLRNRKWALVKEAE